MPVPEDNKRDFQEQMLSWFEEARRNFPWRFQAGDPFAILIAEKLLQQTAARPQVVQAYEQIMRQYPTPQHMANADVQELKEIVSPLGFAYRAHELKAMAETLVTDYNGKVPRSLKKLLALPGVGDYTARAVLSFSFKEDVPVVDTNVARFLYRLYGIEKPLPSNPARKRDLINLAGSLVPEGRSMDFNLAILDLCALICTPTKPACTVCPVQLYCEYGSKRATSLSENIL